jgi:hypothetical protein
VRRLIATQLFEICGSYSDAQPQNAKCGEPKPPHFCAFKFESPDYAGIFHNPLIGAHPCR